MADISVLDVLLHGKPIGTLTFLPGEQTLFAFTQAYIDDEKRPTLSLSFKEQTTGGLVTDIRPTRVRVPPFFANLLPEGALRDYLAERAGVNPEREFFLLWVLGKDLPGGLVVQPAEGEPWPPDATGVDHGHDGPGHGEDDPTVLRFSLAGVQLKFSAVMEKTGGLTIPVQGVGGSWILKLPSTKFDGVPENEYSMLTLASRIGIDIPEIKLIDPSDISRLPEGVGNLKGQALAIKRFDRMEEGGSIHMEDFAQVFGVFPQRKYERASYRNIAEVIWAEIGEEGIAEFIQRLVFNVLIGNGDMHLKNWSLIYPDTRTPVLSPGYDFVSTIAYLPNQKMALSLVGSKKFEDLSIETLTRFAGKATLPEKLVLDTAKETVERFHDTWTKSKGDLPLPRATVKAIDDHVKQIPLANWRSESLVRMN